MELHRAISGAIPNTTLSSNLPNPAMYLERRGKFGEAKCGHPIKKGDMYLRIPRSYYRQYGAIGYATACKKCAIKVIANEISNMHFLLECMEKDDREKDSRQSGK